MQCLKKYLSGKMSLNLAIFFLPNSDHKNVDLDVIHALKNFSILLYLLFLYLNM